MKKFPLLVLLFCFTVPVFAQQFNGLDMNLGNLYRLSNAKTRSISPENLTGEKGKGGMATPQKDAPINTANASHAARELGQGWKVNPFVIIKPGQTSKITFFVIRAAELGINRQSMAGLDRMFTHIRY